jgi:hypothetical protein
MQREILYRLLRSPLGRHLRAIATLGEQSNRTAQAVAWLKANYEKPCASKNWPPWHRWASPPSTIISAR